MTPAAAVGKAARSRVPRSSHADWERPSGGPDPVAVLAEQAQARDPELVPVRHGRMLASPFAFFRGGAAIMAADLAGSPDSAVTCQICGDAHLSNFGGFASAEREQVFDLNDFDETLPGPWEWDVKRLAASIEIAARESSAARGESRDAVAASARSYRHAMREFAGMGNLELWAVRSDINSLVARWGSAVSRKQADKAMRRAAKARSKNHLRALARLTEGSGDSLRIAADPPLVVPLRNWPERGDAGPAGAETRVRKLLGAYTRTMSGPSRALISGYRFVDLARKVVGVGSVGTRALMVLMRGIGDEDPLFLQVKEAQASVLEPHLAASRFRSHGRRVVEGQWLMQASSDRLLGWLTAEGVDGVSRDFYVRQLWDWKLSADIGGMTVSDLAVYGELCGWTLARAHARTGDRVAIAGYLGKGEAMDWALAEFARAYADQNERDHAAASAAVKAGKLPAEEGV